MIGALTQRAVSAIRERGIRAGRPPRRAGQHYFIETEGLHSRIHLQNFYSTFWPQVEDPATAHIEVYGSDGVRVGRTSSEIPRFGALFLELEDLLRRVGVDVPEGTVAIDLEPPSTVRELLKELPSPKEAELRSPFWMAYYDDDENYMYVHSIDQFAGKIFGTGKLLSWTLEHQLAAGARWRSWRLLDVDGLSELQIVLVNHRPHPGRATVGLYSADDRVAVYEQTLDFAPRQVHRVKVPSEAIASWAERHPEIPHIRVGVDPLLTQNGKPYVLMRYRHGPLSLHHG